MSSTCRSSRLGLSHWDPYAMHRGGCLELYYCNMVEWSCWDSSLIWKTNWFPSVLWHCWFGNMTCKNRPRNDLQCVEWDVKLLHYYYHYLSNLYLFTDFWEIIVALRPENWAIQSSNLELTYVLFYSRKFLTGAHHCWGSSAVDIIMLHWCMCLLAVCQDVLVNQ